MKYRLSFERDDNGTLLVTSPDFPPLVTYGDDEVAALRHAEDAIDALIESMMAAREEIPLPVSDDVPSRHALPVPLQTMLKITLHNSMRKHGLTRATLQKRLNWKRESVDRLFRLSHGSKIDQLESAFHAAGWSVGVEAKEIIDRSPAPGN